MSARLTVLVAGATGYIGRHVVRELAQRGHRVLALARPGTAAPAQPGVELRMGDVTLPASLAAALGGDRLDAVVSCLASRSGAPADAWRIEHQANLHLLDAARAAGVRHFVLLSAICVQKPRLQFQHAKLAFEAALQASGLTWSIVRPTAFFKSLAGQVEAVQRGKPFAVFGDGRLTACKPISEADLARFLAGCLEEPARANAILPVGGPGPAITPLQQAELLFAAVGRPVRLRRVPVGVLDAAIAVLGTLGRVAPPLAGKAELARIGRYYATESMLVWDEARGRYDEAATPAFGSDTLEAFYRRVAREGLAGQELGEAAVFSRRRGGTGSSSRS